MKKITDSIKPLGQVGEKTKWGEIRDLDKKNSKKEIEVQFHFDISDEKNLELQSRIETGEVISVDELLEKYSPEQSDIDDLTNWLSQNGFSKIHQSADKCSVYATSNVTNIQNKLSVSMVQVVDELANVRISSLDDPSLPLEVSKNINAVSGLQNHRQFNKHHTSMKPHNKPELNKNANAPSRNIAYSAPYYTKEILSGYNASGLTFSGTNQTIAILIDTVANNSDLIKFWNNNGVNNNVNRVTNINVRNVSLPRPSGEETLDVEWTSGIATNANIRVYASGDLYFTSLDRALDRIISDCATNSTIKQLSISLGLGERQMSGSEMIIQNTKYARLAALGVNIFVSSGDGGSNPSGMLQVEFPSCNPNVVSVGGTSIRLTATGSIYSESGWSGSGGGSSIVYTKPSWQSSLPGTGRQVPDVSAPADPNTGGYVILNNRVYQFGGTSWSAPIWAGICAIVNEARVKSGKSTLPFLPTVIYNYLSTNRFRDITSGNNGSYSCGVGYDKVTGIGTPNIKNLITALISL